VIPITAESSGFFRGSCAIFPRHYVKIDLEKLLHNAADKQTNLAFDGGNNGLLAYF